MRCKWFKCVTEEMTSSYGQHKQSAWRTRYPISARQPWTSLRTLVGGETISLIH